MRSPRFENDKSVITRINWYTVTTRTDIDPDTWRSCAMVGRATETMLPSITTNAVPNDTAAIAATWRVNERLSAILLHIRRFGTSALRRIRNALPQSRKGCQG